MLLALDGMYCVPIVRNNQVPKVRKFNGKVHN